jgi:hypothetical protein
MRRGPLIFALAAVAAASGPCLWHAIVEVPGQVEASWIRWRTALPAPRLATRPDDLEKYPRASFGFVYGNDHRGLDTFAGTFTSALLGRSDTTIALRLSSADLDTIYGRMIEMRFFELPEPYPPFKGWEGAISNIEPRYLEARAGTARKRIQIPNAIVNGVPSDDWKRLYALMRLIRNKIESHLEYRALHPRKPTA